MPRLWNERVAALALIGIGAASPACQGAQSNSEAVSRRARTSTAQTGSHEVAMTPDGGADTLAVELQTTGEVAAGETVRMTIRLRNTAERPIALHLLGREIAFDLVVRDADGAVVWERLEGETVMAILRLETLGPGEALQLEGIWDQRTSEGAPVPPGAYSVQGSVPTDGEALLTPVVPLRIASPG